MIIRSVYATCDRSASIDLFITKEKCIECDGKLRPGVVLFGETLPEDSWNTSLSHIRHSDLVIVIGTSLEVYPASQLPKMTNGKTVYINMEVDSSDADFDLVIKGKAGEGLKQVHELVIQ